jgi:hypothetical protein
MTTARVCIIGAGPSGIAAAKNCIEAGLDCVVYEKNNKVGGNWVFDSDTGHSSVYENTHIISSKYWSEYEDFRMPDDYPDYPNHKQLQAYFDNYAASHGVKDKIQFGVSVQRVEKCDDGWKVSIADVDGIESVEVFTQLMVCNGHHWNPKFPEYPGEFNGEYLHSHDFKKVPEAWRGKRILVIGAGNSACDVAVEAARVAETVTMSMRTPQWFIPKFLMGKPSDVKAAQSKFLPAWLRNFFLKAILELSQGKLEDYGLKTPPWKPLEQHPTANSDLLDFIRHGRIKPTGGIDRFDGDKVVFEDGSSQAYDIIVACTGFWITFPFFDEGFISYQHAEKVPLYRKMMHPEYDDLYFIGLFQPIGCIWPLADYQAMLACEEIAGRYQRPANMIEAMETEAEQAPFKFRGGSRHSTEVDYHHFRNKLVRDLRTAGAMIGKPPQGKKGIHTRSRAA